MKEKEGVEEGERVKGGIGWTWRGDVGCGGEGGK